MWFGNPSNQTQDVDKAVSRSSKCCYGHLFVRWKPVSALQANPMSQSYKRSPEAVRAETVQKWSRESQRVPEVRAEDVTLVRAEAVKMWSQQWRAAWSKLRCLRSNLGRSMIFKYICGSPTHVFLVMGEALKAVRKTITNESWENIKGEHNEWNKFSTITVKICTI